MLPSGYASSFYRHWWYPVITNISNNKSISNHTSITVQSSLFTNQKTLQTDKNAKKKKKIIRKKLPLSNKLLALPQQTHQSLFLTAFRLVVSRGWMWRCDVYQHLLQSTLPCLLLTLLRWGTLRLTLTDKYVNNPSMELSMDPNQLWRTLMPSTLFLF